ncbi:Putative secreted protein [Sphingopyxis fribergensis]|uniref:Putative secreted protein n=1 Tax=Sphingopyxis fribergensis TaxID=1515612 RepID=A0A0A7PHI7_9SPHN|nr:hypothetical protein [Sphingopyxis fribergensis]AJA09444.1 Putative secreted protein [Sphingopyxis fribergensis]
MRTLTCLLIGLLVSLSIGFGSIAHAVEAPEWSTTESCAEDSGHTQGEPANDPDEMGLHNHGGCHGHHQVGAVGAHATPTHLPLHGLNFVAGSDFMRQLIPDANLRPPIA